MQEDHKAERLAASEAYIERVKRLPPMPYGIADEYRADPLRHAVATGNPKIEAFRDLDPLASA